MTRRILPKKLLVEGDTDKRVMPYLLEANGIAWIADDAQPVVHIEPCGGIEGMLKPGAIEGELAASGLEALGAVVDANGDAHRQWTRIRNRCLPHVPSLPTIIPEEGMQATTERGPRFGVWIMPDNRSTGMLESFLAELIPDESKCLFALAQQCLAEAAQRGAAFRPPHAPKASIHTWLAWQDEPGKSLHQAVDHRVLDPATVESKPFVRWFRHLFSV